MPRLPRCRAVMKCMEGALFASAFGLWVASMGYPWLFRLVREPRWALGIGSGRVKIFFAQPGAFAANEDWLPMFYGGLDGSAIRWGIDVRAEAVRVVALPLWPLVSLLGA